MKKWLTSFYVLGFVLAASSVLADKPVSTPPMMKQDNRPSSIITFTPPSGWSLADAKTLPPSVRIMVVGKGHYPFPPSMNLSTQPFKGTLRDYLKIVKGMNDAQGYEWKDLGTIQTQAGSGSLSQVDNKSEWGTIRLMHTILLKNGTIYILTASALKDEFPQFYRDFFTAMKSLRVNRDIFEMIPNSQRKLALRKSIQNLQSAWQATVNQARQENPDRSIEEIKRDVFQAPQFQTATWIPFKEMLTEQYQDMGSEWQTFVLNQTEEDLFETPLLTQSQQETPKS